MIKKLTPMRALRAKCLDCCCNQKKEVNLCPSKDCSLWLYRLGKNPNRAGIGNRNSPILQKSGIRVVDLEKNINC
jgi:hypothetical protein